MKIPARTIKPETVRKGLNRSVDQALTKAEPANRVLFETEHSKMFETGGAHLIEMGFAKVSRGVRLCSTDRSRTGRDQRKIAEVTGTVRLVAVIQVRAMPAGSAQYARTRRLFQVES